MTQGYTLNADQLMILARAFGSPDRYRKYGEYHACNMFQYDDRVLHDMGGVLRSQYFDGVEIYGDEHVLAFKGKERTVISGGNLGRVVDGCFQLTSDIFAKALENTPAGKTFAESFRKLHLFLWLAGLCVIFAAVLGIVPETRPFTWVFAGLVVLSAARPLLEPWRTRKRHELVVRYLRKVGYVSDEPAVHVGNGDAPAPA